MNKHVYNSTCVRGKLGGFVWVHVTVSMCTCVRTAHVSVGVCTFLENCEYFEKKQLRGTCICMCVDCNSFEFQCMDFFRNLYGGHVHIESNAYAQMYV